MDTKFTGLASCKRVTRIGAVIMTDTVLCYEKLHKHQMTGFSYINEKNIFFSTKIMEIKRHHSENLGRRW